MGNQEPPINPGVYRTIEKWSSTNHKCIASGDVSNH